MIHFLPARVVEAMTLWTRKLLFMVILLDFTSGELKVRLDPNIRRVKVHVELTDSPFGSGGLMRAHAEPAAVFRLLFQLIN